MGAMRKLWKVLASIAVVALLGAAGACGGSGSSSASQSDQSGSQQDAGQASSAAASSDASHKQDAQNAAGANSANSANAGAPRDKHAQAAGQAASQSVAPAPSPAPQPAAPAGTALAALATLPVKGRAPKTGYSRAQFGPAWADVDHNGCDTRDDVLKRDLRNLQFKHGTHECVVKTGVLSDPYTGKTIQFTRGVHSSLAVQIDHVVALSNAWQTGAQQLAPAVREQMANDPYNLLAVDGPANQQKSDGDAATWLPVQPFRCQYVARQIGVKQRYHLWVTPAEKGAMQRILSACPAQPLP